MAVLVGAAGLTLISLVFIGSFMGGLHKPGPSGVPLGVVGTPAAASTVSASLDHQVAGGFTVTSYPTAAAATGAIVDRSIYAALVPGPRGEVLQTASATGPAVTNAIVKNVETAARAAGLRVLAVHDVRPLPAGDPDGISQVFFVTALLSTSLAFGNLLVTRIARDLHPAWQLLGIAVYAVIVAACTTAIADPAIGALTGAPWGLFGIGTLLAFAAAVPAAAAARWGSSLGYLVILLLFVPVGLAASGTTLGPHMITPWYADLGKALPPGAALPAVQNTVYFNGSDIALRLGILSAWAVGGAIVLLLAAILHRSVPPLPGQQAKQPDQPVGSTA